MSNGLLVAEWPAPDGIVAGTTLRDSDYQLPIEPCVLKQVHGNRVVHWGSADFDAGSPEADAIVSVQPGSICLVRTADCLPVLLCARDGSEIAAIHAGWRGLAAGVIERTLDAMVTQGSSLIAWLGPAISREAFEVGHEVREAFGALGENDAYFVPNDRGRLQADLPGLARQVLEGRQVETFDSGLCTYGDARRFYSYRRDGETGRLLSFVYKP